MPGLQRRQDYDREAPSSQTASDRAVRTGQASGGSNGRQQSRLPSGGMHGADAGFDMYGQAIAGASSSAWDEVLAGNRLLRSGSRGEAVEALQQLLVEHGQRVMVDGDFGPGTARAVRAVQARFGVPVDGIVGGDTARALDGQSPSPTRGDQRDDRQQDSAASDTTAATTIDEVRVNATSFVRQGLREQVFSKALTAFKRAWRNGDTERLVFTVIDYEMSSRDKRMWVIDLATGRLLFHERVTHGNGSDRNHDGRAERMSNENGSNASNVGLLRTAETYHGRHGESLRLDGLERGFNEKARRRAIVMHPADYADDQFLARHGRLGRSQGCPALDPDVAGEVIETVKGGSLIFGYYPDPAWLRRSRYLN